jgi:protein-tyrosine phosphatase
VARQNGLDISRQRARQIQKTDLDEYDLILAMDSSNHRDILAMAQNAQQRNKVHPILRYSEMDQHDPNVPDPYWDDNGFQKVYQLLDIAVQKTVDKILQTY